MKMKRALSVIVLLVLLCGVFTACYGQFGQGQGELTKFSVPTTPLLADAGLSSAKAKTSLSEREYVPVYIPKSPLPDPALKPNPEADVTGVLVYNGNVYYQNVEPYAQEQAVDSQSLIGEPVGNAVSFARYHNLIEQGEIASAVDFYAKNPLSANFEYNVFTVKGYDGKFRLMARTPYLPKVFDRVEDMWVSTGADLLTKANVQGNIRVAEQSSMPDSPVDLSVSKLEAFVTALYEAPAFVPDDRAALNRTPHANLNLVLNDGTVAGLHLYEGGLVSSELYFRICFQMHMKDFDPIYQALEQVKFQ